MAKMDFLAFVKLSSQECLLHSNVIHFNVLLSSPSLRLSFALHLFIAKVKGKITALFVQIAETVFVVNI